MAYNNNWHPVPGMITMLQVKCLFPCSVIAALFLSATLLLSCAVNPVAVEEFYPQAILTKAYGPYDLARSCWITKQVDPFLQEELSYCMNLDSSKEIATSAGRRWYVLAAGKAIDGAAHGSVGLVGAFVLERQSGKIEIVASDAKLITSKGVMGDAPHDWKLIELGPDGFWGWINSTAYCYFGNCGEDYTILAPRGSRIVELAGFGKSIDDQGACFDDNCGLRASVLESTLEPDKSVSGVAAYPLRLSVQGKIAGKPFARTWVVSFDNVQARYIAPKEYPMNRSPSD